MDVFSRKTMYSIKYFQYQILFIKLQKNIILIFKKKFFFLSLLKERKRKRKEKRKKKEKEKEKEKKKSKLKNKTLEKDLILIKGNIM